MLKSHEKFHSANGKRLILIADDEMINREILGQILCDEYEIMYAEDGEDTLAKIRENTDELSLVLLDILMPGISGLDVLLTMRGDPNLSSIPVIVMTSERDAEVESLKLGAIDFIPKPYPPIDVIRARVLRTIELSEDRAIIQSTERDELTGLYNLEYFYRYAEQFDQHHKDLAMDAIVVDVNHFHMINERYGKAYGDAVLKRIGEQVRGIVAASGGIVCRKGADTFLVYCPHREDYPAIMDTASIQLADEYSAENRVRLRMGVYSEVDKELDIERRFDCAKMAADRVKGSVTNTIGIYDYKLHQQQLYAEQLIEDFPAAIAEKQFKVYYQPKFDIRPDVPILTSAEALVRWVHPKLGMVSPGAFIPLFEENGLIERLDAYVWQETAAQIRDWRDRLGYAVPVSVNVSRVDLYDPHVADTLQKTLEEQGLTPDDLLLEITESAYTEDSEQIITKAGELQRLGFKIEIDDFGTGYSSLNLISSLPIDALKLDMHFVHNAFKEGGNTHMLEVIIGLSEYLSVPVIAEGVETEEQLHALKSLGCDIVQGYFFSRPVPAGEFEAFILQKKEADLARERNAEALASPWLEDKSGDVVKQAKLNVIREQVEHGGETQAPAPAVAEETQSAPGVPLKAASYFSVIVGFLMAVILIGVQLTVNKGYEDMKDARGRYITAQLAATNLEMASDYLTDAVRSFVVTGDVQFLKDFFTEVEVTKRRDTAVQDLEALLQGGDSVALESLGKALALSNELVNTENLAMRLMVEAGNYDPADIPAVIASMPLPAEYAGMTPEELRAKAIELVFDDNYRQYKDLIRQNVDRCTEELVRTSSQELDEATARLNHLVQTQTVITVIFLLLLVALVILVSVFVRKPLTALVAKMEAQEPAQPTGVEELRYVTRTYNEILEENREARERLSHEAARDALTGLFNRGAYDLLMESADTAHMALILVDVDYFKQVNDTYGHAVGDRVLQRVAEVLRNSFRSVDILCRTGGDEFVVVMTRVDSSMRQVVLNKINNANQILQHPKDDLPPVSLSVGVAFADRENPQGTIYEDADTALYRVKEAGRAGVQIYE